MTTCTCGKPSDDRVCDDDRDNDDHDPAWHGNLAALTNAYEEGDHD